MCRRPPESAQVPPLIGTITGIVGIGIGPRIGAAAKAPSPGRPGGGSVDPTPICGICGANMGPMGGCGGKSVVPVDAGIAGPVVGVVPADAVIAG